MLCTLIPANSRLYFYYAKLGFATVFYNTVLRYTSAHTFPVEKYYAPVDTGNIDSLYDAFTRLMNDRNCCIQHNREQFETIQADNRLCDGMFTAIADEADGQIAAMAWAIPESGNRTMKVIDILARDEDSYNAVLRELQLLCPNKAITVMERPNDNGAVTLTPKGMARLVRPDQALTTVARKFPSLKSHIRVSDPILPENNAIYSLSDGEVKVLPYNSRSVELDLDITIEVLTAILFSSGHIGQIMGLPAERPFISLMLD
ncbi:MAG: sterol carrier protein domain-containing protein [Muribaculaceae bacterium]|nr:sterol carrier protein domain-containing protein [Muribaculaceae bacterium]